MGTHACSKIRRTCDEVITILKQGTHRLPISPPLKCKVTSRAAVMRRMQQRDEDDAVPEQEIGVDRAQPLSSFAGIGDPFAGTGSPFAGYCGYQYEG